MALLQELYPDFMSMSDEGRTLFIRAYRDKRLEDLQEVTSYSVRKTSERLTDAEKALLKSLGIKVKDLKALKSLCSGEVDLDDEEEDVDGIPRFEA